MWQRTKKLIDEEIYMEQNPNKEDKLICDIDMITKSLVSNGKFNIYLYNQEHYKKL